MPPTYRSSASDDPAYKAMICGRTEDIVEVLGYLKDKGSVVLFGERRIGKTSFLYLLRDIINGTIQSYQHSLIDSDFASQVATLRAEVAQYRVLYIDLHNLNSKKSSDLAGLISTNAQENGLWSSLSGQSAPQTQTLSELFANLAKACGPTGQLAILIDEMEVVQDFSDKIQFLRLLRGTLQKYSCIHFVLAGAESAYRFYREESSPIYNTMEMKILSAPAHTSIEQYLVAQPLADYLTPTHYNYQITLIVIEWTGCKPFYVQAICRAIVDLYQKHGQLPEDWKSQVQSKVYKQRKSTIQDAYIGGNIDELSQKILKLLANRPNLTKQQISEKLGYSEKTVEAKIEDLLAFYKINEHNTRYRIVGSLIEQWGEKHLDTPKVYNPWPARIRGGVACILILLAIGIFVYIHPSRQNATFHIPQGVISVGFPASVEQDETGTATILVYNNSITAINGLQITLDSPSNAIDYTQQNSDLLTFNPIAPGTKQSATLSYQIHSAGLQTLNTQMNIKMDGVKVPISHQFALQERIFPFQKYLVYLGTFLGVVLSFIAKPDLLQLLANLISQFLSGFSANKP